MSRNRSIVLFCICTFLLQIISGVNAATTLTIKNNCKLTVKPALLSNVGTLIPTIGFLQTGESRSIPVPDQWSGILWGRTLCSEDVIEAGKFQCITGGNFNLTSKAEFPTPPTTVAEFKLSSTDHVYSVSLVHGFNLPMAVVSPQGDCKSAGCFVDLNADCPLELRVLYQGHVVGCQNKPPNFFKSSCPHSSYYAGKEITFSCEAFNYEIIFCPSDRSTGYYDLDEDNSTEKIIPTKTVIGLALGFLLALFIGCLLLIKNRQLLNGVKFFCQNCYCCNNINNF